MPDRQFCIVAEARAAGPRRGEVKIYSHISRWSSPADPAVTSRDFDEQLKALGELDEITVRINSPGGAVTEAIAIRTTLLKHPAKKTVDIEGCCDSAATLIACLPGARVRMAKGGEYMIHRCSTIAWGHADDLLSAYHSAAQTDKDMAGIYAERTGKSEEECLKLMEAETWLGAEEAIREGFVDEMIQSPAESALVACAVDTETMALMREVYAHAPERATRPGPAEEPDKDQISHEDATSAENKEGGENSMEVKDLTAEALRQENPGLAQSIADEAVTAERERVKDIRALTPRGAKWEEMASKAIADGTSAADFLKGVIAAQAKTGEEYIKDRAEETKEANAVGSGDAKDHDDPETRTAQAAKDIAELAKTMSGSVSEMC